MLVSGAIGLLLALALLIARRPPTRPHRLPDPATSAVDRPGPAPWRRALAIGVVAGILGAGLIALRAGPLVGFAAVLVARRGVGARDLALGAAGLLCIAIPAVYLLHPPENHGGYAFAYASELIVAHWIATAALVLLALALWRLSAARPAPERAAPRRGSPDRAPEARDRAPAA
jgi:hypothetical protein